MPAMSMLERAFCRSLPWRAFTRGVVFPWALTDDLAGEVLELGSGSGANAAELLARFPGVRLTATDVDPNMLDAARRRLARFGDRVHVEHADATALPFPDARFDAVVGLIMLHHVIDWERALTEALRVLRPGGVLAGYDLVSSGPAGLVHRFDRSAHRFASTDELRRTLADVGFQDVAVTPGLGGLVARFRAVAPMAR